MDLNERPFLAYLVQCNREIIEQLYESERSCLGVFRMLPPLAQQCVALMTYNTEFDLQRCCSSLKQKQVADSILLLRKLGILVIGDRNVLRLREDFRINYFVTVVQGASVTSGFEIANNLDEKAASKDLFKKAVERWECILSYLANPTESAVKNVGGTTRELFNKINFTKRADRSGTTEITSLGFQFLLLGRSEQIWTYLIYYFKFKGMEGHNVIPLIEFFFRLCLSVNPSDVDDSANGVVRKALIMNNLTAEEQDFLMHLRETGLIFIRKRKDGFFFITPLFASLITSNGLKQVTTTSRDKGFLITETNYRLYAYTNSSLHLSILATFADMICRFDNFVVAHMTRESVRKALSGGITARQITQYLRANSHPKAIETHGALHCVPPTVVDQVHLWEEERERLACQDCAMYSTFDSEEEYIRLRNFATERGILLYDSNRQKIILVTNEGHTMVREWYQSQAEALHR